MEKTNISFRKGSNLDLAGLELEFGFGCFSFLVRSAYILKYLGSIIEFSWLSFVMFKLKKSTSKRMKCCLLTSEVMETDMRKVEKTSASSFLG